MFRNRLVIQAGLLALIALFIWRCSAPKTTQEFRIPPDAKLSLSTIDIQASPSINSRKQTLLDIVYVYDKEALRRLNGFTANGWFSVKETSLVDWKGQIEVTELSLKPGDKEQITDFPQHGQPLLAVVFFGRYPNNALHRYIVVGGSKITVQLEDALFVVGGN